MSEGSEEGEPMDRILMQKVTEWFKLKWQRLKRSGKLVALPVLPIPEVPVLDVGDEWRDGLIVRVSCHELPCEAGA